MTDHEDNLDYGDAIEPLLVAPEDAPTVRRGPARPPTCCNRMKVKLTVRPVEFAIAIDFVSKNHRHHKQPQGHRFSLACFDSDRLCGVAVVGRPVARLAGHPCEIAEVTRLCTDGTRNACSILYSACARVCKEMGFIRIQTYILEEESGTSLKASGWICDGISGGGQWKHTDGKDRRTDQPVGMKYRWSKSLSCLNSYPKISISQSESVPTLFDIDS